MVTSDESRGAGRIFDRLSQRGQDPADVIVKLESLSIETPSWGYADTGTRFGKFHQPAAARSIFDKLDDAAHVHKLTGKPIIVDDWVASFSLGEPFDTKTECGIFFDEQRATEQASEWLVSAFEQPHIIAVFKCTLIGLHDADRRFGGKSRRTYFRDDGTPFPVRTEMMKKANRDALRAAYAPALKK